MGREKHLLIGAGPAALSALQTIKRIKPDDEVVLVTKEDCLPYSPTVLPYLLSGKTVKKNIWLKDEDYFRKLGAVLMKGREVVGLDPVKKRATLADGEVLSGDKLLIATGSDAVGPSMGDDAEKIDYIKFHTLDDCETLIKRVAGKKDVLIHGGGLVAMEVATALVERECPVKIVVRSRILRAYFDEDAAGLIEDIFAEQGVEIISGSPVASFSQEAGGVEVALEGGKTISAEVFVNCTGVKPRVAFLGGARPSMNQGLLSDRRMMTSIADVYAAGDVAEAPDFFTGAQDISAILLTAINQGRVAGANMCGQDAEYNGWIGLNRIPFFGNVAESLGIAVASEERFSILKEADREKRLFKKLIFEGDNLVGATFINCGINLGLFYQIIERKLDVSRHKDALFDRPFETSMWLIRDDEKKKVHHLAA